MLDMYKHQKNAQHNFPKDVFFHLRKTEGYSLKYQGNNQVLYIHKVIFKKSAWTESSKLK